jgi:hypothetical protein
MESLPREVVWAILDHCTPAAIVHVALTSRHLHATTCAAPLPSTLVDHAKGRDQFFPVLHFLSKSHSLCRGHQVGSPAILSDLRLPTKDNVLDIVAMLEACKTHRGDDVVLALKSCWWIFDRLRDAGANGDVFYQSEPDWDDDDEESEHDEEKDKARKNGNRICYDLDETAKKILPIFSVEWADSWVSPLVCLQARTAIDAFAEASRQDLHPGSNNVVRDVLHPSLFCLTSDQSTIEMPEPTDYSRDGATRAASQGKLNLTHNFYGRDPTWFTSHYQWLPVDVQIGDKLQSCKIISPLNNIDWQQMPQSSEVASGLVTALEQILLAHLPALDRVWGNLVEQREDWMTLPLAARSDFRNPSMNGDPAKTFYYSYEGDQSQPRTLKGRTIQVVPKIAEYEFDVSDDSKCSFEGVFHIEGMPTENIVATVVHVLDRDDALEGGEIEFKRQFTRDEFSQGAQNHAVNVSNLMKDLFQYADSQFVPLGTLPTPQGRSFVFPNHLVHKVKHMGLVSEESEPAATQKAKRRIVAFFLIDPSARICSSSDVPLIAERGISFEEACAHRSELMKERSASKQAYNSGITFYGFCEH